MKKLDAELQRLVQEHGTRDARIAAAASGQPAIADPVRITIEFRGELADLEALGFVKHSLVAHPTKGYKIATGTIPVSSLEALAAIDHVTVVSAPQALRPLLNYSADEIRAVAVRRRNPGGATGRGVVVGVIDTGVEVRHGVFYDDTFHSRIIALWDQKSRSTDGVAGPGGLGRVYDRAAIEAALSAKRVLGTKDRIGHGTLVTGVAAGDGSPATCCVVGNTYVGIAPAAEIIVVGHQGNGGALGDSQNAIDGLDFIFTHPDGMFRPLVVNLSLGVMRGAHDGSTALEKAIDAHTASRRNSVVVVAAGNFANKGWHTKGDVPPRQNGVDGTFDVKFKIGDNDVRDRFLEIWYTHGDPLSVRISAPGNVVLAPIDGTHANGILPPDAPAAFVLSPQAGGASIEVNSVTVAPENLDSRIQITIAGGARPKGEYTAQLSNAGAAPIAFHAWLEREERDTDLDPPRFSNPTPDVTISVPATAREAIAVAAFHGRENCCNCFPSGDIADFSSLGPVRELATLNVKPNIAAPGVQITSAAADASNLRGNRCDCCPDACCCLYNPVDGTSFAAPHVTGTIALMLEVNPTLTRDQIATILHDTALPAPPPASIDVWGAGKLNADAAVQRAASTPVVTAGPPVVTGVPTTGSNNPSAVAIAASARGGSPAMAAELRLPETGAESAMRMLAARVRAVPGGETYAALISRHFSEVRRLINANPRIATMWHRGEGPAMLRRLLEGTIDERAEPPVRNAHQREYLMRFFDQLGRFGSARLNGAIKANGEAIVGLLERPLAAQIGGGGTPA